ncbi:SpaA isopeptide-forming pilin-related protein [Streptococcus equinus]|uniref:SpaA isopeptide-forming pilin-related protein n=1 Tax=Streptococcus equinus TaxID=1335 RepID=UPI0008E3A447|nr:SpaA isopeptide-forming pilin-related protein [Streptococcus equinus]SFF92666.1 LPXTG-motif cell wall anchor domain-containing protein/fimbrial isopeptide formation D2 domain-containing protein [Streptococcus equinus]
MKKIRNVIAFLVAAFALLFTGSQVFADTTGTITVQNAEIGKVYKIYKLFDATVGANGEIAYTLPSGKTLDSTGEGYFTVDSARNVTAKNGLDVSSTTFQNWAKTFGTQVGSDVTATSNTVTFDNLPFGYYYIESELGTVITIDSTTPSANVVDKNTGAPTTPTGGGKTVTTVADPTGATKSTAAIGDTVHYTIKFNATNYIVISNEGKKITNYTVVDTPSNLTITNGTVHVKVGNTDVTTNTTVTIDPTTSKLTISIPWVDGSGNPLYTTPSEVTVTYDAVVKTGAISSDSLLGKATNKATITYNYGDNSGSIPTNEVEVDTLGIAVRKQNESNGLLSGAQFKLYDAATGGNEIKFVHVSGDYYRRATESEIAAGTSIVDTIPAGAPYLVGLDKGTYYLEEVKAPAGYNKLTTRQSVEVTGDGAQAVVVNKAGTELPSTGSFGTRMLYVVGAVAILVASVYMVAKRRVKNL